MEFLKQHESSTNISETDLLAILEESEHLLLNNEDSAVRNRLYAEISTQRCLPSWWTSQESAYLSSLTDTAQSLEYLIFRHKFHIYPKEHFVPQFPNYVLIEPVSSCNLRCPFCFQSDKSFTRKPFMGFMDMDLFVRIVDECEEGGTGAVTIASRGEPTLHPRFVEMMDYLSGKFFETKINTNATRLTSDICHALLRNEVNDIVLSIDSEQPDLFELMRKNAKFDKVLDDEKSVIRLE